MSLRAGLTFHKHKKGGGGHDGKHSRRHHTATHTHTAASTPTVATTSTPHYTSLHHTTTSTTHTHNTASPTVDFFNNTNQQHKHTTTTDAKTDTRHPPTPAPQCIPSTTADAQQLRRALKIHVYGDEPPPPVQSAADLAATYSLRPALSRAIQTSGYHELTRVQMQAIPSLLSGRELLACAPTGSGKTAAFVIPIVAALAGGGKQRAAGVRALILSPTQELARQTLREVLKLAAGAKLRAAVLTRKLAADASAASRGGQGASGSGLAALDILVATPLRVLTLLRGELLSVRALRMLILDEADKLLDLGFVEQVTEILAAAKGSEATRALFSATMLPAIEELATTALRRPLRVVVGEKNAAAEEVVQELQFVGREDGKMLALRQMVGAGIEPPVLIFVQSKERAVQLFHRLMYDGLRVDVIHAERSAAQRDAVVEAFRMGRVWVLIATEVMARGMDFKGVRLVINYDFPQTTVSYIHRIGRTGRAGRPGRAVTFFTEDDIEQLRAIANVMKASGCAVPEWMLKLKPMRRDVRKRLAVAPRSRKAIFKQERGRRVAGGPAGDDESAQGESKKARRPKRERKNEGALQSKRPTS